MSRMHHALALLVLFAALVAACGRSEPRGGDTTRTVRGPDTLTPATPPLEEPPSRVDTTARPAAKRDTIALEGDPHEIAMRRVDTDLYSTYYPSEEMTVEQSTSGEGTGVRFTANFGGKRNDSAFLHIFTPGDPKAGPDAARKLLLDQHGIVRSNGWSAEKHTALRCGWALESYQISGPPGSSLVGFACIGEHRGRGVVAVAVYPEGFEEGMGPRIAYILDELVWSDTQTRLGAPLPNTRKLEKDAVEHL
jgi:hypothetical protein